MNHFVSIQLFLMAKQDFFIFLSRFSCKVNSKLQISQQLKGQCQINLTSFDEKTKKIIKLCRHRSQIAFSNAEIVRTEKKCRQQPIYFSGRGIYFKLGLGPIQKTLQNRKGNWRHVLTQRKTNLIYDSTRIVFWFLIISDIKLDKNKKNSRAE